MDLLKMSMKEVHRLEVMQQVDGKRLKEKAAAELLGMSERQVKRLLRSYRQGGASGLISKRRGRPSNKQLAEETR
jgi:transposase